MDDSVVVTWADWSVFTGQFTLVAAVRMSAAANTCTFEQ